MSRSTCFRVRPPRHLREISELQAHQRGEVELLYRRLGKAPPPGLGLSNVAPHSSRRKRSNRHKLKPGKLLSPLVQQFRNVTSKTTDSTRSGECRHPRPVRSQRCGVRWVFLFLYISRCCCRNWGTGAEFKRFSGQGSVPGLRQGSLLHQSHSQLHLGAGADSAALLPQGLSVLW